VAINELGHHAVGEVVPTEEGFVRIIMQQGAGLKLRLTGEGCLLAEGDPRMVAEALKDGIDLNELNHLCPE